MPVRCLRSAVSLAAAAAMMVQAVVPPALAQQRMTREQYEACQARDDASFKAAIEALTLRSLQDGLRKVDYRAVVADEWRRGGMDDILDKRVDIAVGEVGNETSLIERGRTLFDKEKAQAMAVTVAERVYRSDAVKTALEGLIVGVAREVGRSIELAASDAAEPALECLRAFLGPRYGTTVARVVSSDAQREFQLDPAKASATVSTGTLLTERSGGLTGAVILAVRGQLANIASRVGQRLVGSVLGRLVSVVAGGVGVILIAKDLWELRQGVLPIIATEMKSRATKDLVQAELAKAISEQINDHVREIAVATADRVIEIWRDFRRGHAKVLDLAERHGEFRKLVDTLKPADLPRLDEVVALILPSEGEDGVIRRLGDGTLLRAVLSLPPAGMEIARETRALEQGLAWTAVAGPLLPKVLEHGLHRRGSAADFSGPQLGRLFGLDDKLAIARLSGIGRGARDALFELKDPELRRLARGVTEPELDTLARYLGGLDRPARERVLQAVAASPARMQALAPARVRDAILASRDQLAAVSMMLRSDSGFDVTVLRSDLDLVTGGRVSPVLLWDKHPIAIGAAAFAALALLLMLRRLMFGRRPAKAKA